MVVNGDGKYLFRPLLPHDILVQKLLDVLGLGNIFPGVFDVTVAVFFNNASAQVYASQI